MAGLHERHPGLTQNLAGTFAEALAVCISRWHSKSPIMVTVRSDAPHKSGTYPLRWAPTDGPIERAFANAVEATRDAAYGLAIAVVERHFDLVAWARAEEATGADYYVCRPDELPTDQVELDLEDSHLLRLEVSGVDDDTPSKLNRRARIKVDQLMRGRGIEPGYAAIAGFHSVTLLLRWCEGKPGVP